MPVVPEAALSRPIGAAAGIGRAHDQVATGDADAQRFYDQGLSYLHNYVWIDAARSFNEALRRDSSLILAYVGLSISYDQLNQRAAARTALARARSLRAPDDHERRHLLIRERQLAAAESPGSETRRSTGRKSTLP